jgi:putative tricarboxylic transport membrane protein
VSAGPDQEAPAGWSPDGRLPADRIAGGLMMLLALATAWLARGFRVSFPADPVGPRALPLFAAGLLAAAGLSLLLRPGPPGPAVPRDARFPLAVAVGVLAAYPVVLPLLGFVASTTAAMGVLAVLFGAPPVRALVATSALAGALYLFFAYALGVPLPIGRLFLVRGG